MKTLAVLLTSIGLVGFSLAGCKTYVDADDDADFDSSVSSYKSETSRTYDTGVGGSATIERTETHQTYVDE